MIYPHVRITQFFLKGEKMSPEIFYEGVAVRDLAAEAYAVQMSERNKGHTVSLSAALALKMRQIGVEKIKVLLSPVTSGGIAEEIGSLLRGLSAEQLLQFYQAFGGVVIGCTVIALEQGAIEGWSDEIFGEAYNFAITGTPLPPLSLDRINGQIKDPRRSPEEETRIIRQELAREKRFIGFFDNTNRERLPQVLENLLYGNPHFQQGLARALPVYGQAVGLL